VKSAADLAGLIGRRVEIADSGKPLLTGEIAGWERNTITDPDIGLRRSHTSILVVLDCPDGDLHGGSAEWFDLSRGRFK